MKLASCNGPCQTPCSGSSPAASARTLLPRQHRYNLHCRYDGRVQAVVCLAEKAGGENELGQMHRYAQAAYFCEHRKCDHHSLVSCLSLIVATMNQQGNSRGFGPARGIETFESCQGGPCHSFPDLPSLAKRTAKHWLVGSLSRGEKWLELRSL